MTVPYALCCNWQIGSIKKGAPPGRINNFYYCFLHTISKTWMSPSRIFFNMTRSSFLSDGFFVQATRSIPVSLPGKSKFLKRNVRTMKQPTVFWKNIFTNNTVLMLRKAPVKTNFTLITSSVNDQNS